MDWEKDAQRPLEARVRYRLKLPTGFPDKYRAGIVKAMELCAVKRHIQNPPTFTTEIVE
jgi:ribosomal protein S12 methylthiotransferase accessory factor